MRRTVYALILEQLSSIDFQMQTQSKHTCLVLTALKCADGRACFYREVEFVELPRVGDTFDLGIKYEDMSCNPVEHVYHHGKGVTVFVEGETVHPDDGMLDDFKQGYVDDGWILDKEDRFEAYRNITKKDLSDIPVEPKLWLIEQQDGTELLIESTGRVAKEGTNLSFNELDDEIEKLPPELRDRIIKRFLLSVKSKGRLSSVLYGDLRESLMVNVKVAVYNRDGKETWTDSTPITRVPVVGESIELFAEAYRVLNVLHTNPQCGVFAKIICVALDDYDPKNAKLENIQPYPWVG